MSNENLNEYKAQRQRLKRLININTHKQLLLYMKRDSMRFLDPDKVARRLPAIQVSCPALEKTAERLLLIIT